MSYTFNILQICAAGYSVQIVWYISFLTSCIGFLVKLSGGKFPLQGSAIPKFIKNNEISFLYTFFKNLLKYSKTNNLCRLYFLSVLPL